MSIRSRKFIYIYETYESTDYLFLQNIESKYHIIAKSGGELHGFVYFNEASSEDAVIKRMKNVSNVFSTADNHIEISAELKKKDDFWEKGKLPRFVREKSKKMGIEKICKTLVKQNNILMQTIVDDKIKLQEQNAELQKALLERPASVTNNDNSKRVTNINVFLNTECKDAITLKDFVNQLVIKDEDIECMKQLGYVESVTQLLKRSLHEYELHERPIHCIDMKREIMHVKDQEGWKKELSGESPNIDKAFRQISHIHRKKMSDVYRDIEVESSGFEEKAQLMYQIASAAGSEEEKYKKKIIKNISENIKLI